MVLSTLVTLRIALDSVFVDGLSSLVHTEVFERLCLVESSLVHQVECRVLGLNLTEGISSFEELTVQVQTHCSAVVVFRFDLQAAITFFTDFFFTGITEARSKLDSPHKATVLLGPEIVVRHFEVESEVTEDAHILDVNRSADDRVAFLSEASTNTKVRRKVVSQGEAHFEVSTLTTFIGIMNDINEGEFSLHFEETVESAIEERNVQVRRDLISISCAHENELEATVTISFADSRSKKVLDGNADEQVTVLRRSKRVPAQTYVSTNRELLEFIKLVDVKHIEVDTKREQVEKSVSVTELSGNFAIGFTTFNGSTIFEKGEAQSVLVVNRVCQADIFLASFATNGAKECSAEFELIGFRNTSRVHVHGGVTTK